ncbi:hypothetical protein [Vibrio algicola]|uniref:Uncharacterized protein n=1 Tax=Vibrio algicola TaxID=2662262 RepID=A0A5Q0TKJ5_9VIBR|nr:hypothetical protein [Vibrio algicola]
MDKVKLILTRGAVVSPGVNAVKDEVIEVGSDIARNLRQAGAAKVADKDAKIGKPATIKTNKK